MENSVPKTPFPVDELETLYFGKKASQASSDLDGNVVRDSEQNPTKEIPSTNEEANSDDQQEFNKDQRGFDQNLTQFLASKKDSPNREEKVERAANLGLA